MLDKKVRVNDYGQDNPFIKHSLDVGDVGTIIKVSPDVYMTGQDYLVQTDHMTQWLTLEQFDVIEED